MKVGKQSSSSARRKGKRPSKPPRREFHLLLRERQPAEEKSSPSEPRPRRPFDSRLRLSEPAPEGLRDVPRQTHRDARIWTPPVAEEPFEEERTEVIPMLEIGRTLPRSEAVVAEQAKPPVRGELDPVFDRVVQEVVVTEDRHRRRTVRMRLSVRGESDLDVELRRGTHGVEVRFSTENEELRRELRRRRSELTDRARQHDVSLAAVRVD